jgi:hypothetical protein
MFKLKERLLLASRLGGASRDEFFSLLNSSWLEATPTNIFQMPIVLADYAQNIIEGATSTRLSSSQAVSIGLRRAPVFVTLSA